MRLTAFTFGFLAIYVPIEVWYSLPRLWDPFFLVDLIGIVLLAVGAMRYRRTGTPVSLGTLTAGYAWTSANFWRALFGRLADLNAGGELDYGWLEVCFTSCILIAAAAGLFWSLVSAAKVSYASQRSQ